MERAIKRITHVLVGLYGIAWFISLVTVFLKAKIDYWALFVVLSPLMPFIYLGGSIVTISHGHMFTSPCTNATTSFTQSGDFLQLENNCGPFTEGKHTVSCFLYEVRDDLVDRIRAHPAIRYMLVDNSGGIKIELLKAFDQKAFEEDISGLIQWHMGIGMPWRYQRLGQKWTWPHSYSEGKCVAQNDGDDLLIGCTNQIPDTTDTEAMVAKMWKGYFNTYPHYVRFQKFHTRDYTYRDSEKNRHSQSEADYTASMNSYLGNK